MTTGLAPIGGNGQTTPQGSEIRVYAITRNALEIHVAANGTVRAERIAEAYRTSVKTSFTSDATPGEKSKHTNNVVHKASPRAAHIYTFADGAIHLGAALIPESPTA